MKKIHLSIPTLCHEKWNEMTPQEQGRFCGNCQTTVVDFTTMSDSEVLNYFKKNQGNTCGRFAKKQVDKTYVQPQPSWTPAWMKAGILASGLLTANGLAAQSNSPKETTIQIDKDSQVTDNQTSESGNNIIIKGTLTDENKEPLLFASVTFADTTFGTTTDFDGHYELEIPDYLLNEEEWILEFSYIGFAVETVVVKNNQQQVIHKDVAIDSELSAVSMGIIVCTVPAYQPDRTIGAYINKWLRPVKQHIRSWNKNRKEKKAARKKTRLAQNIEHSTIPAVISVETTPEMTHSLVYPNPFTDNFNLKYSSSQEQIMQITITDVNGKVVFIKKENLVKGENSIELIPNLPNGNYWLRLETENEDTEIQAISRIVKY